MGILVLFRLQTEHIGVFAVLLHQLVVAAALNYHAVFEHKYSVGVACGGKTVRYEHNR